MSEIVQLHTTEQVILQTSSDESITLTGNAINVVATPFDPSVLDDIRIEYQTADTALREELLGTGGGSTVYNGTYDGSTLHSFAGEMSTGVGYLGAGITQEGSQHIQITVPDVSSYTYWYVFAFVSNISSAVTAFSGAQPPLFFTINKSGSNFEANAVAAGFGNQQSIAINAGDVFDLTFTTNSITVLQNGNPYFEGTATTTVATPHTHVLSLAPVGFITPADLTVTGLMPAGAAGIIDTKLSLESTARQNADTNLTTYINNKISFVNANISSIQTLAETNQLNINDRVLQAAFDSLAEIVMDNGLLLAQKASQSYLDNLATEVSTKATPSDITAAIATVVGGAPAALDTLYEIVGKLAGDEAAINDLLIQINGKVRFDAAQSLTTAQQLQARQNISAEAAGVAAGLVAAITAASIGAATAAQGSKADSALQSGDVAPVALSGSYTALLDKPTIINPVNADWNSNSGLSQILNKPTLFGLSSSLTGLGVGTNTVIAATDSLIAALAKLQAQITSASSPSSPSGVLTQPKFNGSRYPANLWYDCFYPFQYPLVSSYFSSYQQYLIKFTALEDATFTKLGFWCPTTNMSANDGGYYLGVYSSDSNGNPSAALYRSAALTNVNSTGAKTTTLSISLTKGQTVWLSVLLYAYSGSLYYTGIRQDNIVIPAISGASALNAASATAYISTLANVVSLPATIDMGTFSQMSLSLYLPRLMLGT